MFEIHSDCGCGCSGDSSDIKGIFSGSSFLLVDGQATLFDLDLSKIFVSLSDYLSETFTVLPVANGVKTFTSLVGGSGYNDGNYYGVILSGGTGVQALANLTVVGGIVTTVQIANAGYHYSLGDVLTCNAIGLGTGFTITVDSLIAPIPLSYANIAGTPNEVKLVIVVPEYDRSLLEYPSQQVIQWRFQGTSTWSNIGPIMVLTGAENPAPSANSNLIGEIEFQNLTTKAIRMKILLGV